jgi:mannose-1-phosphate guanylyltransferase/mannose-6-phosphate isomerase
MIPVVLSGGMGTRLWPLSRANFPKQFCELMDESLLQKTLKRVQALGSPWALTVRDLDGLTGRVFRGLGLPQEHILLEPFGRNTAPAIALLCKVFEIRGLAAEVVGIFPADHLILNEVAFVEAVNLARRAALKGYVATLGIRPDQPATGFGYIETRPEAPLSDGELKAYSVAGFREKPDRETAETFLQKGNFFWNAGIFVFQASRMIDIFKTQMPRLWALMQDLASDLSNMKEIYSQAPSISIDYGVMEKLKEQVCVPCDIGWSDLGSWDDVARFDGPDNLMRLANHAQVVESGANGCFVYSSDRKVYGLVDVEDLIVVDTPDAMLVTRKGHSQNVRSIVDKLNQGSHAVAREHLFEVRPWGRFTVLKDEHHYKSKLITVDPQAQLSYQSHTRRSEHWIIVRGEGEVVLDNQVHKVKAGDSIFIPVGTKHRIRNTSPMPLEFIEVQTGSYFGEDDITRYQDDYNRA